MDNDLKLENKPTDVANAKDVNKLLTLRTNVIHNVCTSKLIKIKLGETF